MRWPALQAALFRDVVGGYHALRNYAHMTDWGAIVSVTLQVVGYVPQRVLDEIMEELSDYSALVSCKEQVLSLRLFVAAPDRDRAMHRATSAVLGALRALEVPHDADSAHVLALDPIEEFQRDFPAPE